MKVLVADDDPVIVKLFIRLLDKIGAEYDVANDGAKALSFCRQIHYDMIILDNVMPEMNGLDVLRSIQAVPYIERTCIIFVTTSADVEIIKSIKAEKLRVADFLVKPIDITRFLSKLKEVALRAR